VHTQIEGLHIALELIRPQDLGGIVRVDEAPGHLIFDQKLINEITREAD
jgi:hypothetical protein